MAEKFLAPLDLPRVTGPVTGGLNGLAEGSYYVSSAAGWEAIGSPSGSAEHGLLHVYLSGAQGAAYFLPRRDGAGLWVAARAGSEFGEWGLLTEPSETFPFSAPTASELVNITSVDTLPDGVTLIASAGDSERLGLPGGRRIHTIETFLSLINADSGTGTPRGLQKVSSVAGVWVRDRLTGTQWGAWTKV